MASTQDTIAGFFQKDHAALDACLGAYRSLKRDDPQKARESFVAFKTGLQRHIVWEEDVLFPCWERQTGMTLAGPTRVMRLEHRLIGEALEALHRKVADGDPETDAEEKQLVELLTTHNRKEECVLYPDIDGFLNDQERTEVFAEMTRIPESRFQHCCGHGG